MRIKRIQIVVATVCGLALPGMQRSGVAQSPPSKPVAALPDGFFLEKEPEGAKYVEEVKAAAKPGDKVAIRGRIGGNVAPFVEGRAVFTIVGNGIQACSDKKDKCCETPWDYCCDTADTIAKHSATIQVVDAKGFPLRVGLKGANGLKELSDVIIVGTVKEAKDKILIVNATAMYLVKS